MGRYFHATKFLIKILSCGVDINMYLFNMSFLEKENCTIALTYGEADP
jgi:hypothetical protein